MSGVLMGAAIRSGVSGGGGGGGGALAATVNLTDLDGYVNGEGVAVTAVPAIVTATGGVAPYAYDWTFVSGDTTTFPGTDTSYSSYFYKLILSGGSYTAVWKCKVTDNVGTIVYCPNVTILLESLA